MFFHQVNTWSWVFFSPLHCWPGLTDVLIWGFPLQKAHFYRWLLVYQNSLSFLLDWTFRGCLLKVDAFKQSHISLRVVCCLTVGAYRWSPSAVVFEHREMNEIWISVSVWQLVKTLLIKPQRPFNSERVVFMFYRAYAARQESKDSDSRSNLIRTRWLTVCVCVCRTQDKLAHTHTANSHESFGVPLCVCVFP